jgi:hypothetical protein
VKWKVCTRPKKWGGLGFNDLHKFGRALRLRWLWYSWDAQERPWKNLLRHQDRTNRSLFFATTVISVGDGANTPFWEANWLNGTSPKMLAPNLYKQARFKFRTVKRELNNMNWIKNLGQINTETLMDEFILMFIALNDVVLNEEKDTIAWKWARTGEYSAASAYEIQFLGSFLMFKASSIWRAKAEAKCHFFAWLATWNKVPTADNLLKKKWPCEPTCPLCFCMQKTTEHLLTNCNFSEAVWDRVAADFHTHPAVTLFQKGDIRGWLSAINRAGSKCEQQINAGVVFFF